MKKTCLFLAGIFFSVFELLAQPADSSAYRSRKLSLQEIHFVSSYYQQDGNNSAVTGGIGTEALTDYSNQFEIKLRQFNRKGREIDWEGNLGVDYYTSASSDKINPYSISSASARDLRIYPSVTRRVTDDSTGQSWFAGLSYSHESDYRSHGIQGGFSSQSKDRNREWSFRGQLYYDQVKIILPIEMRTPDTGGFPGSSNEYDYPWRRRLTVAASVSWSAIINTHLRILLSTEFTSQQGFLGLPFHRIYYNNYVLGTERLPSNRVKWPVSLRASWFVGDQFIFRPFYRFYIDDWGIRAHTAEWESVIKVSPYLSLSPFYRFYSQQGADYFAEYLKHDTGERYVSSNYDLSSFNSHFAGMGLRYTPLKGLIGNARWRALELRYGYYRRSNGLHAHILSLHIQYKRS